MDVFTMDHSDLPKINHEDTVEELEPEYSQAVRGGREGGWGGGGGRRRGGGGRGGEGVGEGGREGRWVVGRRGREGGRERRGGGRGEREMEERERGFTCSPNFIPLPLPPPGYQDLFNRSYQASSPGVGHAPQSCSITQCLTHN